MPKVTHLVVCRILIRSVIFYGCIAHENDSTNQKKVMDIIRYKGTDKGSSRALKETSLASIQVLCGEIPQHARRKQSMMEFIIQSHPMQTDIRGRKLKATKDDTDPLRSRRDGSPAKSPHQDYRGNLAHPEGEDLRLRRPPQEEIHTLEGHIQFYEGRVADIQFYESCKLRIRMR